METDRLEMEERNARFVLACRGRNLDCRPGAAVVMGILNVTPDSFSDGGAYPTLDAALRRTEAMLTEGARVIDVGGESTRPRGNVYGEGAGVVTEDEESKRVAPVVEAIAARYPEALISVDTYKPSVARRALEAGAHMINDITGLRLYPETAQVAARYGAPLILMHSLGRPGQLPHSHTYDDVVSEVKTSLADSVRRARAAGVRGIAIDPGFGFGKTAQENLKLIHGIGELLALGHPIVIGVSRKSTIGAALGSAERPAPVDERLFGSLGATAVAVLRGAGIVRTHDVRPTVDMLRVIAAINGAAVG